MLYYLRASATSSDFSWQYMTLTQIWPVQKSCQCEWVASRFIWSLLTRGSVSTSSFWSGRGHRSAGPTCRRRGAGGRAGAEGCPRRARSAGPGRTQQGASAQALIGVPPARTAAGPACACSPWRQSWRRRQRGPGPLQEERTAVSDEVEDREGRDRCRKKEQLSVIRWRTGRAGTAAGRKNSCQWWGGGQGGPGPLREDRTAVSDEVEDREGRDHYGKTEQLSVMRWRTGRAGTAAGRKNSCQWWGGGQGGPGPLREDRPAVSDEVEDRDARDRCGKKEQLSVMRWRTGRAGTTTGRQTSCQW